MVRTKTLDGAHRAALLTGASCQKHYGGTSPIAPARRICFMGPDDAGAARYLCRGNSLCTVYAGVFGATRDHAHCVGFTKGGSASFRVFSCPAQAGFRDAVQLTLTEGRDDAWTTGEGRLGRAVPITTDGTSGRPSSLGVDASSQAARPRVRCTAVRGRAPAPSTHICQYMRNAQKLAICHVLA